MKAKLANNTAYILLMISYHLEQTTKEHYLKEFNGKQLWEKQEEETCDELSILLESQRTMDFSKFSISMN